MGLLEVTTSKVEVDGQTFEVRRPSALLHLRLVGTGALGTLRALAKEQAVDELTPEQATSLLKAVEDYLSVVMLNPKLGKARDLGAEPPIYTLDDLGELAIPLWLKIRALGGEGESEQGFQNSSPGETGAR